MAKRKEEARSYNFKVTEIFNPKTSRIEPADYWLSQSKEKIARLRYRMMIGEMRKECPFCKSKLLLKYSKKQQAFFSHIRISEDRYCHLIDKNSSNEKRKIQKYNHKKESKEHIELKEFTAYYLSLEERVTNVEVEKVVKNTATPYEWKRPDVRCNYGEISLVFEIQISNTWLSDIVRRDQFYKETKTFILWVFNKFDSTKPDDDATKSDIFYNNPEVNAFVLDEEAKKKTEKSGILHFHCWFQQPYIDKTELKLKFNWEKELVSLEEMHFDSETYRPYFKKVMTKREKLEKEIQHLITKRNKRQKEESLLRLQQEQLRLKEEERVKEEHAKQLEEERLAKIKTTEIKKRRLVNKLLELNPEKDKAEISILEIDELTYIIKEVEHQLWREEQLRKEKEFALKVYRERSAIYHQLKKSVNNRIAQGYLTKMDGTLIINKEMTEYCMNLLKTIEPKPFISEELLQRFGYSFAIEFGQSGSDFFVNIGKFSNTSDRWSLIARYKHYLNKAEENSIDIREFWEYCFSVGSPNWVINENDLKVA